MCEFVHPDHPEWGTCVAAAANHEFHQFNIFENNRLVGQETEPNVNYIDVKHRTKDEMRAEIVDKTDRVREEQRQQRRSVGRSSVGHPSEEERMEGAEQAGEAMEPEFIEAAMGGGRAIMRRQERMTADDLWDWLDTHEHYTEHPKGMKALLGKLIKEGTMEPVPDSDPDSHRTPRRSNPSRLLRVYRSLIYIPTPEPARTGLRNFD